MTNSMQSFLFSLSNGPGGEKKQEWVLSQKGKTDTVKQEVRGPENNTSLQERPKDFSKLIPYLTSPERVSTVWKEKVEGNHPHKLFGHS